VARWGVVSNNEIMTGWSERLGLGGPQRFRRHVADAADRAPALPEGFELRPAREVDVGLVLAAMPSFPVWGSDFGSQNFVHGGSSFSRGWGLFNEVELRAAVVDNSAHVVIDVAGGVRGGAAPTPPMLLFDASGALVAFAGLRQLSFGESTYLAHQYMDGTPEGIALLVAALPAVAHAKGYDGVMGYVPALDWLLEVYEASPEYRRATKTEQLLFSWRAADYVAETGPAAGWTLACAPSDEASWFMSRMRDEHWKRLNRGTEPSCPTHVMIGANTYMLGGIQNYSETYMTETVFGGNANVKASTKVPGATCLRHHPTLGVPNVGASNSSTHHPVKALFTDLYGVGGRRAPRTAGGPSNVQPGDPRHYRRSVGRAGCHQCLWCIVPVWALRVRRRRDTTPE
jgi:hypothetical protein